MLLLEGGQGTPTQQPRPKPHNTATNMCSLYRGERGEQKNGPRSTNCSDTVKFRLKKIEKIPGDEEKYVMFGWRFV